jgi:hypothetical protein
VTVGSVRGRAKAKAPWRTETALARPLVYHTRRKDSNASTAAIGDAAVLYSIFSARMLGDNLSYSDSNNGLLRCIGNVILLAYTLIPSIHTTPTRTPP